MGGGRYMQIPVRREMVGTPKLQNIFKYVPSQG